MSGHVHVKCACAHRRHQGQCPNRACGCLLYRPPLALPAKTPAIIAGTVEREPAAVSA